MGSNTSAVLAIVYMHQVEQQAILNLNIGLYKRYVDDSMMLTTNRQEAELILQHMNSINRHINFENNNLNLLDFSVTIDSNGDQTFNFYKKKAKKDLFVNYHSALPIRNKTKYISNEISRIENRCTNKSDLQLNINNFAHILRQNDYPEDIIQKHCRTKPKNNTHQPRTDQHFYFEFPYIDDKTDSKIKRIFKRNNINVRIYRKSTTLRQKLQKKQPANDCTKRDCPIKDPSLCHSRMCIYMVECSKCQDAYIGSTIRQLHQRATEHETNKNSSVFRHKLTCQSTMKYSIIATARDIVKLRFLEAIHIKNKNPKINSKEESNELNHLIFT